MTPDPDLVRRAVAALSSLGPTVEVDGQVRATDSAWFLYGHIDYDGEVVIGEYPDAETAAEVLRAVPRRGLGSGPSLGAGG